MADFVLRSMVVRPADAAVSRITDLVMGPAGMLYSTTRFDGQITGWDISGSGLTPVDDSTFAGDLIAGNQPWLTTVMTDGGPALLSGGTADGGWSLRALPGDGTLGPEVPLTTFSHPLVQPVSFGNTDGSISVYAGLNGRAGLVQLDLDSTGALDRVTYLRDRGVLADGDITAVTGGMVAGVPYLFAASRRDAGISAWEVRPDGGLIGRDTLRPADGLRLETPTALESLVLDGTTYVIAAGAVSDSLTVLAVDATGQLSIADHVIDSRHTRFDGVTALATTLHDGQAWVFAGGADDGISAFQLLPGGRLLHRAQIADTTASTLANLSALSVRSETGSIAVFAASATKAGLTRLHLAHDPADQVILDTPGVDALTGGAGADVFVFGADGGADTITDFTLGEDRVDLSAWAGLRSKAQLVFDAMPDGIRITYGDESLRLQAADGRPIAQSALSETDLIGQTTLPLTLTAGLPGPVTPPPDLPARYVPPAGTPAPAAPVDAIEGFGSGGNDRITGGAGPDLLFGQSGDDLLRGAAGDDLLFGGPGTDRLEGGLDDDQLFGGEGRDLGWLNVMRPVDPTQDDALYGGAGDDRLYGQAGRDRLDGGTGDDLLVGGAGRDSFVFRAGHDVVADFDPRVDRLLLDAALAPGLSITALLTQVAVRDGTDVLLRFSPDASLRLENTSDAALFASDIAFL